MNRNAKHFKTITKLYLGLISYPCKMKQVKPSLIHSQLKKKKLCLTFVVLFLLWFTSQNCCCQASEWKKKKYKKTSKLFLQILTINVKTIKAIQNLEMPCFILQYLSSSINTISDQLLAYYSTQVYDHLSGQILIKQWWYLRVGMKQSFFFFLLLFVVYHSFCYLIQIPFGSFHLLLKSS